jgi:hypothetical protein
VTLARVLGSGDVSGSLAQVMVIVGWTSRRALPLDEVISIGETSRRH